MMNASTRQPCAPSSSGRGIPAMASAPCMARVVVPAHRPQQIRRRQMAASLSGAQPSPTSGSLSLQKLTKALKSSRMRLQTSPNLCEAAPAAPAAPTTSGATTALEQEYQALAEQLRMLEQTGCLAPDEVEDNILTSIDVDAPQFARRTYAATGQVLVCQGKKCSAKRASGVLQAASAVAAGSPGVEVLPCKCLGKCKAAAAMRIKGPRGDVVLTGLSPESVGEALDDHLQGA